MAELTEYQKESYNIYISEGINEDTANKLATGELTADEYQKSLNEKTSKSTEESTITEAGYDVELIDSTKIKMKKKSDEMNNSAAAMDISGESMYLADYKPSKKDIINSFGINTEVDNELPAEVRAALSLGLQNDTVSINDAKKLYINEHLIEDKNIDKELLEQYKDKIEFKYQKLPKPSGKGEYKVFTYKVPVELGGTNKWTTTNAPTILPTKGDLAAIAGDVFTVGSAIASGIGGSFVTPVVGTAVGSAGGTFTAEMTKKMIGRHVYGLGEGISEEDYFQAALTESAILAGIDLVATPAFLLTGQAIKKAVLTAAKDKISSESIENLIKSGGNLDEGLLKNLDEAKKILKDHGIDEKLADDYLVANVNKAFPEADIVGPKSVTSKILAETELAEKAIKANKAERELILKTSGLDEVDNLSKSQKDDIVDRVASDLKDIRTTELKIAKELTEEAEGNVVKLRPINTDPTINEIDNMGITFSQITDEGIKPALKILEKEVDTLANKSPIKYNLNLKETKIILKDTLDKFNTKLFKKMAKPSKKNKKINDPEYVKLYNSNKAVQELYEKLSGTIGREETVSSIKLLQRGLKNIDSMTYQEANSWKAIIRSASENESIPVSVRNPLIKIKGDFDKAIQDGLTKDPALLAKHNDYEKLLYTYKNSFINNLADSFGYGSGRKVIQQVESPGIGRSTFEKFTDGSNESINQAFKLSQLLKTEGVVNTAQKNKINNALYNNYFNKVYKTVDGKPVKNNVKSHDDFIEKYGENYKLILGDKVFKKFASNSRNALKVLDDAVEAQIKVNQSVSKALPGMPVSVLDTGNPDQIVKQLLTKMKGNDITQLVKNLNTSIEGKSVLNDVRKIMVIDFLDNTKVNGLHNGVKLDDFISNNREVLEKLFNKEFVDTYRSVAKALTALQDVSFLGAGASQKSVTEMANQAGMFIDIFAGPLNHKRLIVNRLARIWDSFSLGGDNMGLLLDYKMFIEAAKKQALGGNYNVMLDALSGSPANKNLFKKLLNSIGISTNYKGISSKPLVIKEYLEDKVQGEDRVMSDEPDTFTAVDEILSRLGDGVKRDVVNKTRFLVTQMVKYLKSGKEIKEIDMEKQVFEEKLK
mgnify:FL=1